MAKSSRAERRQAARDAAKLARSKMKLAALEPGGSEDRPIEVESASVVEPHAASTPCVACGGGVRVEEHLAVTASGSGGPRPLRVARVRCARCGTRRDVFYRIGTALPS